MTDSQEKVPPSFEEALARIDPSMHNTCRWLAERGYTISVVGVEDEPMVSLLVPPELITHYARHLRTLLFQEHGVLVQAVAPHNRLGVPTIVATYDPSDDTAVIDLMGVDDSKIKPNWAKGDKIPSLVDRAGRPLA